MRADDIIKAQTERLKQAGYVHARREVELLFTELLSLSQGKIVADNPKIDRVQIEKIESAVARRLKGEPLGYIIGNQAFRDIIVKVDQRALIPRPETEALVELVISNRPKKVENILEIGTGSGAIAITLKKTFPKARVVASDISKEALELARENSNQNQAEIELVRSDLFLLAPKLNYDIVVANLPYVPDRYLSFVSNEILNWEPMIAVSGGSDGLKIIRRFIDQLPRYLDNDGLVALEIWHTHGNKVVELAKRVLPQKSYQIHQDLAKFDRFLIGR